MIKQLKPAAALLAGLLFLAGCGRTATDAEENSDEIIEPNLLYGIPADNYRLEQQIIDRGETLGQILNRYGVSAAQIDQLDKASKDVFPLRNIRAGRSYTAFIHEDSLNAPHLDYLVYEQSISQYVVFRLADDSISVTKGEKEYEIRRQKKTATIDSSLWEAIVGAGMPAPSPPKWRTSINRRSVSSASRKEITSRSSTTSVTSTPYRPASDVYGGRNSTTAARPITPFRSARAIKSPTGTRTATACAS